MIRSAFTAAKISQFAPKHVAVTIGQQGEVLIIRATPPPPPETSVIRATLLPSEDRLLAPQRKKEEEENPFILPALTAPALLQMNARPKRREDLFWTTRLYTRASRISRNENRPKY
jgi:hypothetical protein